MFKKKLNTCADDHEQIVYTVSPCPVCVLRKKLDEMIDDRITIQDENIEEVFKELKVVRHRLEKVEERLSLK